MTTSTHQIILQATIDSLLEHGVDGTTTKRIAQKAGVNEVTLFRLFGNKAKLLQAALEEETRIFEHAAHYTGHLEADLTTLVEAYHQLARERSRLLLLLYFELQRRPEFAGLLAGQVQAFGIVAELLARYQSEGRLIAEPPAAAAVTLLGPLIFAAFVSQAAPHLDVMPDPAALVQTFLHGRLP